LKDSRPGVSKECLRLFKGLMEKSMNEKYIYKIVQKKKKYTHTLISVTQINMPSNMADTTDKTSCLSN
jgi:hypothetical protein